MKILSAAFFKSAHTAAQLKGTSLPEIAFSGRSNVGKSSLINCLLNRRGLAKTSSTPGRTQAVNFIDVNCAFYFVDLPGYGYARVPEAMRRKWGGLIASYLENSRSLRLVILIVDPRRDPSDDEILFIRWLLERDIPAIAVLTKIDKIGMNMRQKSLGAWKKILGIETVLLFSALSGEGKDKIWKEINGYLSGKT
ncbi:MAG: ribosome biogenesis GTP-binding protein YihA/YsxC [Proteobacteria bacterium]|nr:ribosome biogenesis GTP-binding protein YihA/YsxC [Pseudomonadota bacterium]